MLILTKTNLTEPSSYLKGLAQKQKIPVFNSSVYFNKTLINNDKDVVADENTPALAISGIADTQSFHKTLEQAGINICDSITFIDHHNYVQKDIDEILKKAQGCNAEIIVTTEKDLVKLKNYDFDNFSLFGLEIRFKVDNQSEQKMFDFIDKRLSI